MDKYEVIEEIGGGTFRRTLLVWHKTEKKKYVLKKIQLVRPTERSKQTAQREIALISRIKNSHIVECKEAWMEKGCFICLVTDYCEDGNMAESIKDANGSLFSEAMLCKWFVQLLIAMDSLHSNHILHRDLKCSNIFLTKDQDIRLGDFGLAKLLNGDDLTPLVQTPNRMCPELLANTPYSFKSDIWSLGCCMFEMTAHRSAFVASDAAGLTSKINRSSIGALPSSYSSSLKNQIKSMLRKNQEHRPTASELMKSLHLQKYLVKCTVPPSPVYCPSPVRKLGNSRRESGINHCGSSLIKDKGSLPCPVISPRRRLHSSVLIKSTNDAFHPWPVSSSGDDSSTTTNVTKSNAPKEEECSLPNTSVYLSSSRSGSATSIGIGSLHEVNCTFKHSPFLPSDVSSGQTTMNCNASIQTQENCVRPSVKESMQSYKVSSSDTNTFKCDNEMSVTKKFQERAAALESLLELCAELLEQNRLKELGGILKPFGKHGASPRETAIWLSRSLKTINQVHYNREKFL
ncbi:hypothetical protein AAC387_Pa02g0172 [Persea americana]